MAEDLDAIAERAYSTPPDLWIEDRVEQWIAPKIAGWCHGHVLDMGWGTGTMARALRANGVEVEVLEGSAVLRGAAMTSGFTAWHAQFEDFAPGPSFDTVLALFVLEHVEDPVGLLRRVRGWLKPGGRLICVVPNAYSWHRLLGSVMTGLPVSTPSERDLLVGHVRVFGREDLDATVLAAGFELDWMTDGEDPDGVAPWFGWFHKSLPNSMLLGCSPEVIDGLCELGWSGRPDVAANIGVVARVP